MVNAMTLIEQFRHALNYDNHDLHVAFSILKKLTICLFKVIIILSEELNCQIFATTHSKECIEAYYRVSKKLDDEDICFIELGKVKGEIKALVLDKEMFLFELEQSHEVRGW